MKFRGGDIVFNVFYFDVRSEFVQSNRKKMKKIFCNHSKVYSDPFFPAEHDAVFVLSRNCR